VTLVDSPLAAALAGRYALERELGQGGMATVYLARDLRHERLVAVKVLRPELAASLGPERFLREIKLAAQLQHPSESGACLSQAAYLGSPCASTTRGGRGTRMGSGCTAASSTLPSATGRATSG
jgi:serine/threonine protein kinase